MEQNVIFHVMMEASRLSSANSGALKVVNRTYLEQLGKFVQRGPAFIE